MSPAKPTLASLLSSSPSTIVPLDGALATELEDRGLDLSDSLWSARALAARLPLIRAVHAAYFRAGARVAITASYQASVPGFAAGLGVSEADAVRFIADSVALAAEAKADAVADGQNEEELYIAGSVGPYGAYLSDGSEYRGDYDAAVTHESLKKFHRPRIAALLGAGADVLALETQPSLLELKALLELLRDEFPAASVWLSFTLRDAEHISDGTALADVLPLLEKAKQVFAVGLNCTPRAIVAPALRHMRSLTALPLVAYPNSGEEWDAASKTWTGARDGTAALEALTKEWADAGARLIGVCCRSGPDDVAAVVRAVNARHAQAK